MRTLFFAAALALLSSCAGTPKYAVSDHFDGEHFFNPGRSPQSRGLWDVIKWRMTTDRPDWPERFPANAPAASPSQVKPGEVVVTWIGHSTFLLQFEGVNVLTDPIFSLRATPVSFAGPARVRGPGVELDALPRIDAVVVSHNHYDHLDLPSLEALVKRFPNARFYVPLGNARLVAEETGAKHVEELDWWESRELTPGGARFTLAPAQHWSARGLFDRFETLWGSWWIAAGGATAYFAGDTGYGPHFKAIRERLGAPALALLPIGAYEPRWFMQEMHMNPEDAVLAHRDLGARHSLPMHYGTFRLSDEAYDQPVRDLAAACDKHGVSKNPGFQPMEIGETRTIREK